MEREKNLETIDSENSKMFLGTTMVHPLTHVCSFLSLWKSDIFENKAREIININTYYSLEMEGKSIIKWRGDEDIKTRELQGIIEKSCKPGAGPYAWWQEKEGLRGV